MSLYPISIKSANCSAWLQQHPPISTYPNPLQLVTSPAPSPTVKASELCTSEGRRERERPLGATRPGVAQRAHHEAPLVFVAFLQPRREMVRLRHSKYVEGGTVTLILFCFFVVTVSILENLQNYIVDLGGSHRLFELACDWKFS